MCRLKRALRQVPIHGGTFGSFSNLGNMCKGRWLDEALRTLDLMYQRGIPISSARIQSLLQACTKRKDLSAARRVHAFMAINGLETDSFLGDHLIRLFAVCGRLQEASEAFYKVSKPTIYTWNAIISAFANLNQSARALELYEEMKQKGINPDKITFLSILKACIREGSISHGRLTHVEIVKCGLKSDVAVSNTIVDMYAKCGSLKEAHKVFDNISNPDVISWSVMIAGCAIHGPGHSALELFEKMQHKGIEPNLITFSSVLRACSSIGAIKQGTLIYNQFVKSQCESDLVIGSTLVDMYAKCGSLKEARKIFDDLQNPDVVSWGAMISGYAMYGDGLAALDLFEKMQQEGIQPNRATFLCALKACGSIGAIEQGKVIHAEIITYGLESDLAVESTLVDIYAKCGNLEEACKVFDNMSTRDAVAWGAMVAGYAIHGNCKTAWQCLKDMQQEGFKPGDALFTSILTACSNGGLLEEGHAYFKIIRDCCAAMPSIEHYACMVDLLGRAGQLHEAEAILQTMPISPDIIVWRTLLACCKIYGNLELGIQCFNQAVELDASDASGYVLMSNMYADLHMWEDVDLVEKTRNCVGAQKKPGTAWIEVRNRLHEFVVAGQNEPQTCAKLCGLVRSMKEEGYMPQLDFILEPVTFEDNEGAYCRQSEELKDVTFSHPNDLSKNSPSLLYGAAKGRS